MAHRSRREQVEKLTEVKAGLQAGRSRHALSEELGVPRSTLRRWSAQTLPDEVPAMLAAFFETEEGLEWLHGLVLAAHMIITLMGGAGIRLVCRFLELIGLAPFVATSYGSQQKINVALEEGLLAYAEQQGIKLVPGMPKRQITVSEDETFHPEICLVGLEPVSNFILLERYAKDRSAATWTQALEEALQGMPVEVVQGTSDEAKGLLRHVEKELGAHHSPDLFHVQREISKATSLSLARDVRQAEQQFDQTQQALKKQCQARDAYHARTPLPRGRPPAFEQRIAAARGQCAQAEYQCRQALERQQQAREAVREIGAAHHPYDIKTGQAQPPERVAQRFQACWKQLADLAEQAALPQRAKARIAKARRVTAQLLATLSFFFATIQAKVEALNLAPEIEATVHQQLIPAIYIDRVAERSTSAEVRHSLRDSSAKLLQPLHQPDSPLNQIDGDTRRNIETVAEECADLFQRSSSCVEGRNGQLALHHHGRHRLCDRKLSALTVIHNYFIRRPDGTTAAERFFGQPPEPLFVYLLRRLRPPPRPARKRPRPPKQPYLLPAAA